MDLALNNLQYLICHKTKPKYNATYTPEKVRCLIIQNEPVNNSLGWLVK